MSKEAEHILLCIVRTAGALGFLWLLIVGAKYLELDYADASEILRLIKEYFPSLLALLMFGIVGVVFYRASVSLPDFNFIYFFISKPGVHEDLGKLIYFLLGIAVLWSYFALYWVGKLDTPYVVGTLSVFILQGIAAIAGKSLGKPRDEPKQPRDEPKQEPRPKQ